LPTWLAPLNCRGGFVLFLDKKNQKSSQQRGFFSLRAFARQIQQNHRLQYFCPASHTHGNASAKSCYASPTRKANFILLHFTRSFFADTIFITPTFFKF
jgi:hypothetical protein